MLVLVAAMLSIRSHAKIKKRDEAIRDGTITLNNGAMIRQSPGGQRSGQRPGISDAHSPNGVDGLPPDAPAAESAPVAVTDI